MNKILTLIAVFCVAVILTFLLPTHGEAEVYDNVIRLHVIANSDTEEDQLLKLKVRDAVLASANDIPINSSDIYEAKKVFEENTDILESAAKKCIIEEGYNYDVSVCLTEEDYPTKNYESLCFPAGKYLSLQVKIGEASGENWWCVLFPPLCMSVASEKTAADALIEVGFTSEQYKIITNTTDASYNVRFKILETIENAINN